MVNFAKLDLMLLVIHIILALSSIPLMLGAIANEFLAFTDNKSLLPRASVLTFVGMLATGSILVIKSRSPLLTPCIEGLAYFGALSIFYATYKKLALAKN